MVNPKEVSSSGMVARSFAKKIHPYNLKTDTAMKKSYQTPALHIVMLQHQTQLLDDSIQGLFTDSAPTGGWDAGGASSRQGDWEDED